MRNRIGRVKQNLRYFPFSIKTSAAAVVSRASVDAKTGLLSAVTVLKAAPYDRLHRTAGPTTPFVYLGRPDNRFVSEPPASRQSRRLAPQTLSLSMGCRWR